LVKVGGAPDQGIPVRKTVFFQVPDSFQHDNFINLQDRPYLIEIVDPLPCMFKGKGGWDFLVTVTKNSGRLYITGPVVAIICATARLLMLKM